MTDTVDIVHALNRIADEISEHLAWMRQRKEAEDAAKTQLPPIDYQQDLNFRYLNGRWPRRDGDSYGNVRQLKAEQNADTPTGDL